MPLIAPAALLPSGASVPVTPGIETLTYISGLTGKQLTFGDTSLPTALYKGLTGHGLAPLEHFVVDTAYQAGAKFVRTKKKTAVITVTLTIFGDQSTGDARASLWQTVDQILAVLEPDIHTPGTLIKTDTKGVSRQLVNCQYVGGFEVNDRAENLAYLTLDLLFEAYDPTWYSVQQNNIALGSNQDTFGFSIPLTVPLAISGQAMGGAVITNQGNIYSYPTFTFQGPCNNPGIYNATTREGFSLSVLLNAGDQLVVDSGAGSVTYTAANLSPVPYYGVFGGARQFPRLTPGSNTIQFTRDNPATNQCVLSWFDTWNHG